MGWESRGGQRRYYTRSRREGGRVVREYLGTGATAEAISQLDTLDRDRRRLNAESDHREQAQWTQAGNGLKDFCRLVSEIAADALMLAGYHRHARGEWRKKRGGTMSKSTDLASDAVRSEKEIRAVSIPEDAAGQLALISRAIHGDKKAEAGAIAALRKHPDLFHINYADAFAATVDLAGGGSPVRQEIIRNELTTLAREAVGPSPSPLEKILAERVAVCQMQLSIWERDYATSMGKGMSISLSEFKQRKIETAHRRLLSSIKALAQVRKLQLPNVQVNIGEKQINQQVNLNCPQSENISSGRQEEAVARRSA